MAAAEQGADAVKEKEEQEQVVSPWEVSAGKGGIDYDKLVDQFGCQRLDAALVDRVARLTAAHRTSSSAGTSSSPTGTDTPAKYIFFSARKRC